MSDPIAILYDAALGEEDWTAAIERIARSVNAATFIHGGGNPRAPERLELWSVNWDKTLLQEGGYDISDVWNPTVNPDVAAGLIMPIGRAMHARRIVPEDTVRTSDFLQATVVRPGLRDYHLHVPHRETDMLSGGFIAKGPGRDFDPDEVARIDAIPGHVGRALRLRAQLDRHRSVGGNLSALFDELAYGVLLLDRAGEAVAANAAFERLVSQQDGISLSRGRPALGREPGAAIDAALAVVDLAGGRFPSVQGVPIRRPSGRPPYMARIYPAIGLSENTVKTHLTSIRAKVGARSTAELTRILVRACRAGRR